MKSRQLAMRDPALAALVGAIAGADFGSEASFGSDFGSDFGDELHGDFGADFGDEFGDDFGADVAPAAMARAPHPQAAARVWHKARNAHMATQRREKVLYPNKGSSLQLEAFSFPLNPVTNPIFGTVSAAMNMTNNPDVTIRPERVSFNVMSPGLYSIAEVKTANVGCLVGGAASQDAFFFNPQSVGMRLSCPTLTPSNRLTIVGSWSTLVPPGFVNGAAFPLCAIATGPAQMAG